MANAVKPKYHCRKRLDKKKVAERNKEKEKEEAPSKRHSQYLYVYQENLKSTST